MSLLVGSIRRRGGLVVLALIAVDWGISLVWPIVSKQPFPRQSMGEIRSALRSHHLGMPAGEADLPPPKRADEFVLGIFGGSVADQLAWALQQHASEIAEFAELSRIVARPLRFENLAVTSGREPIQHNVLHLFHDRIDMAVFVDGFNEISSGILPFGRPGCEYVRPFWESNNKTPLDLMQPLFTKTQDLTRLADSWIWAPLSYSGVFKAYLYTQGIRSKQWALDYLATMSTAPAVFSDGTDDEEIEAWRNCIVLSVEYAASVNLPIAFFLQPNQYVEGSKPFSSEERTCCLRSEQEMAKGWDRSFARVTRNYALMEQHIERLRADGVAAFSLSQVYKDVADTIYIDKCCHVNLKGNLIMARAIAGRLLERFRNGRAELPRVP